MGLGTGYLLAGSLRKLGARVEGTVKLYDVRKLDLLAQEKVSEPHEEQLLDRVEPLVETILRTAFGAAGPEQSAARPTPPVATAQPLVAGAHVHAPVAPGAAVELARCGGCHASAADPTALVAAYPPAYAQPYATGAAPLCFRCHAEEALLDGTKTSFRDGRRSLHEVHVRGERGRTCRACHASHPEDQPKLMRTGVPYGTKGWTLKLVYTRSSRGGMCSKTCHAARMYDRGS